MVKLYGVYDKSKDVSQLKILLKDMFRSFGFGMPDYSVSDAFGVGHLKIKTMNRKGICQSKNVVCCFTGKLFDFYNDAKRLKQKGYVLDDTKEEDYILNAYLEYGLDFISRLNGTFVFVVYDKKKDVVYIVNDRCGIKPLYYYHDSKKLVFASEIKAVLENKEISKDIDWDFWKEYFSYGYGLSNRTPFQKIKSLPNASIIMYSKGGFSIKRYWDYNTIAVNNSRSVKETILEGSKVLESVFKRQTMGLKECMILLSGGYDSRCIASSIRYFTNVNIHSYTIAKSYPTPLSPLGDMDTRYAKRVAEALGIQYKIIGNINSIYEKYFIEQVRQLDCLCPESIWSYPLVDRVGDELISFDGLAGDVLMKAGYFLKTDIHREDDLSNEDKLNNYPDNKLAEMLHRKMLKLSPTDYRAIVPFFRKDVSLKLLADTKGVYEEVSGLHDYTNKIKIFQMKNRTKNTISLTANNTFARKTYSLLPFCDNEFVEFALSIPVDMKVRDSIYKKILQHTFPKIMRIPTTNDPKSVKERMTNKLVSLRFDWLRYGVGDIAKLLKKIRKIKKGKLRLSQNPRDVRYLMKLAYTIKIPDVIDRESLLEQVAYHLQNDIDPSYFLEPIMQFCVWYDVFIGKNVRV